MRNIRRAPGSASWFIDLLIASVNIASSIILVIILCRTSLPTGDRIVFLWSASVLMALGILILITLWSPNNSEARSTQKWRPSTAATAAAKAAMDSSEFKPGQRVIVDWTYTVIDDNGIRYIRGQKWATFVEHTPKSWEPGSCRVDYGNGPRKCNTRLLNHYGWMNDLSSEQHTKSQQTQSPSQT